MSFTRTVAQRVASQPTPFSVFCVPLLLLSRQGRVKPLLIPLKHMLKYNKELLPVIPGTECRQNKDMVTTLQGSVQSTRVMSCKLGYILYTHIYCNSYLTRTRLERRKGRGEVYIFFFTWPAADCGLGRLPFHSFIHSFYLTKFHSFMLFTLVICQHPKDPHLMHATCKEAALA